MDSSPSSLSPLQVNPSTGEPYLQLPSPHESIIITPPRLSDAPSVLHHMKDPAVNKWLSGPPQPYMEHHATGFLSSVKAVCDDALKEIAENEASAAEKPFLLGTCPVRTLREVKPDGTDVMLGDVGLLRCGFPDVQDDAERKRLAEENQSRPVGDPKIVWCFGDYLGSSHHGRGIMSAAVATIITKWMVPRMGARLIRVEAFKGNGGSVRVFEKNGFVLEETVDFEKVISSGQKVTGMHVLWWRRS
ncbi:hypothetical protein EIP91_011541 [Steccherinum ochraceum]|uniref:N-acetyltransferase domain-containing protein n=1 Tax=Steccherinum ochraceum TaxID=92696 RepID=A0A4R0RVY6_9APHY|nr:hypothetical protein EIP91_011541 [Steccherinum ochraceum]